MKHIEIIFDIETGQTTQIERNFTEDELTELAEWKAKVEIEAQIAAQKVAAKAALLEKLGITEEEAKLLF